MSQSSVSTQSPVSTPPAATIDYGKVVPWILTLLTVAIGIWQYVDKADQASREPFLREQLRLSFEASDAAARVATETDPERWELARLAFLRLYWGQLGIVENREVEAAMVAFGISLREIEVPPPSLPTSQLQRASLDLAYAVRHQVMQFWDVSLPPLAGER